jgi:glycosyltransferase involved in cell wall biosynthesis
VLNRLAVIVPAHDEEELLPGCLGALAVAAARLAAADGIAAEVIVVADACRDSTAAVALAHGARVLTTSSGIVGVARAAGAALALGTPGPVWLACTDADSQVPPDWLRRQLRHAAAGADLVLGTVTVPDWAGWPPGTGQVFEREYRQRFSPSGHDHVHGANLGIRGSAYLLAGGFPPVRVGEDRLLAEAAARHGLRIVTDPADPVRTSARRRARAPDGFSVALAALPAR